MYMNPYEKHVRELCKEHGIHIEWTDKMVGEWPLAASLPKVKAVQFHKPTNDFLYMVALHEIGHVMAHRTSDRQLEREARAWEWAIDNIGMDIGKDAWQKSFCALSSYVARMVRRDMKNQSAFVPSHNHWFWAVYVLMAQFSFPVVDMIPVQAREKVYNALAPQG